MNKYLQEVKTNNIKYMLRLLPNGDIQIVKMWNVPNIYCDIIKELKFNDGDVLWYNLKKMFDVWEDLTILHGNE